MKEIWKDISGYDGKYQASNLGRIINLKTQKIYIGSLGGRNVLYRYCSIGFVHRLVALTFIPNLENKPEIDHIDFNPLNNRVENLRWVTHSENQIHSRERLSKSKQGEKHPKSLLSDKDVLEIRRLRKHKIRYKILSKKFGISENTLCQVVTRNYQHL